MADFPSSIFSARTAGANLSSNPHSDLHDDSEAEIEAIETELGTNPSGSYGTVSARLNAMVTSWTSHVPSITNVTFGNGTLLGYYRYVLDKIEFWGSFTLGSTSAVSGAPNLTIPNSETSNANIPSTGIPCGQIFFRENGALRYLGHGRVGGSDTVVAMRPWDESSGYVEEETSIGATVPFTWGTADEISWYLGVPL